LMNETNPTSPPITVGEYFLARARRFGRYEAISMRFREYAEKPECSFAQRSTSRLRKLIRIIAILATKGGAAATRSWRWASTLIARRVGKNVDAADMTADARDVGSTATNRPIAVRLYCPNCLAMHIGGPHLVHKCKHCGHEWLAANVPTIGVPNL